MPADRGLELRRSERIAARRTRPPYPASRPTTTVQKQRPNFPAMQRIPLYWVLFCHSLRSRDGVHAKRMSMSDIEEQLNLNPGNLRQFQSTPKRVLRNFELRLINDMQHRDQDYVDFDEETRTFSFKAVHDNRLHDIWNNVDPQDTLNLTEKCRQFCKVVSKEMSLKTISRQKITAWAKSEQRDRLEAQRMMAEMERRYSFLGDTAEPSSPVQPVRRLNSLSQAQTASFTLTDGYVTPPSSTHGGTPPRSRSTTPPRRAQQAYPTPESNARNRHANIRLSPSSPSPQPSLNSILDLMDDDEPGAPFEPLEEATSGDVMDIDEEPVGPGRCEDHLVQIRALEELISTLEGQVVEKEEELRLKLADKDDSIAHEHEAAQKFKADLEALRVSLDNESARVKELKDEVAAKSNKILSATARALQLDADLQAKGELLTREQGTTAAQKEELEELRRKIEEQAKELQVYKALAAGILVDLDKRFDTARIALGEHGGAGPSNDSSPSQGQGRSLFGWLRGLGRG